MGADNWATCPKCLKAAQDRKDKEIKKADDSYGKIPADAYLKLREAAAVPVLIDQTFREDYEIGIDKEGGFYVSYSGSCAKCGLKYSHKYTEQIKL